MSEKEITQQELLLRVRQLEKAVESLQEETSSNGPPTFENHPVFGEGSE